MTLADMMDPSWWTIDRMFVGGFVFLMVLISLKSIFSE